MLNFLHPKSRMVLSVIVFTMTSATVLVSPIRAENSTTTNVEQSTYLSPDFDSSSLELVNLLNSDDLKFSLLEQTSDFTPSVLNTNLTTTDLNTGLEKNNFTQANQYSVLEDFQISEFKQIDSVDFAFIFDFAQ
ncbi:MAG: hypothetical protein ACRC1Z_19145 [Waterburya sp.]